MLGLGLASSILYVRRYVSQEFGNGKRDTLLGLTSYVLSISESVTSAELPKESRIILVPLVVVHK